MLSRKSIAAATASLLTSAAPVAAEMELSLYLGWQGVDDSTLSGTLPGAVPVNRGMNWDGDPFNTPLYYGGRAMWWMPADLGIGVEGTHTKAYASAADMAALGVNRLELSDGHNILTANVMKRWPEAFTGSPLVPYAGAGVGVAVPHVDVRVIGATGRTHGFETTGPALRGLAGLKYDLTENWALFGEYQITWSDNDITVDPDPAVPGQVAGRLQTEIVTHALNFGVSYSF
jgi:lipid A oxidase